jgi:hypothetical protein
MAADEDLRATPTGSSWLTSALVARLQAAATRLRGALAAPAVAALFVFTDREPMWPGVAVAMLGELVQVWAAAHLHKNVQVVKSGPYGWVRNPMYVGRFLVGLGLTLVTWRWFLIAPYVLVFWIYAQARVLQEEGRLRALFGEEYARYCRQVNRWLPRPPRQRMSEARWSWEAVFRNHQLRVTAGVVVVLVLLKVRVEVWGSLWGTS